MDNLSPDRRSANMRAVKSRDTRPEIVVRRTLHRLGYRFRLHVSHLPGKPDLVFASRRKIVFVHGCFWHKHSCKHGCQKPKTNAAFWKTKIAKNVARDGEILQKLRKEGWRPIVVWECEIKTPAKLTLRLRRFLG